MERLIDLRSDTVTEMTPAMRMAMAYAVTGDMLYDDDAHVNDLEAEIGSRFGMRAIWMPSCTMANLIALVLCNKGPGCEVIVGASSHINVFERRNAVMVGGLAYKPIGDAGGRFELTDFQQSLVDESDFFPRQTAVALENTHNLAGGAASTSEQLLRIYRVAKSRELRIHLDGARIFNASVATGEPLSVWGGDDIGPDSIAVSLSKALGTPAGAVLLVRSREDARRAKRVRKALGGTMHTGAGYLAAAALVAVRQAGYAEIEVQIGQDHQRAQSFAASVALSNRCRILNRVDTNIVYVLVDGMSAKDVVARLRKAGILCSVLTIAGVRRVASNVVDVPVRFVFHRGIVDADVAYAATVLRNMMDAGGAYQRESAGAES